MQHDDLRAIEEMLAVGRVAEASTAYVQSRDDLGYLLIERAQRGSERLGQLAKLFHAARHFRLVAECFEQLGEYGHAGQMYERSGDPGAAAEMYWRAKVFDRAAICYEASGSFSDAAKLWVNQGEPLKAGMAFERAGELFLAGKYLLKAGRADRAIPLLQKVPDDDFEFVAACLYAARGLHQSGMSDLALRRLDTGIGSAPVREDNAELYLERAIILMDLGRAGAAIPSLENLASWNFSFKDVAARLKQCRRASATPKPVAAEPAKEMPEADHRRRVGIAVLQRHPLLAGLTLPQLRTLYDSFHPRRVRAGTALTEAGATSSELFVVLRGKMQVSHGDQKLATIGAGSWIGEMALLTDAPASATVSAITDLAVLSISHEAFRHLLDTHPDLRGAFYEHFAAELARRLSHANELVGANQER